MNLETFIVWLETLDPAFASDSDLSTTRRLVDTYIDENNHTTKELEKLLAEKSRLREALAFYADYKNHTRNEISGEDYIPTVRDCGARARAALKAAGVEEE